MVIRRHPNRMVWVGNPLGLPVPDGFASRRVAFEIRPGDTVWVANRWRAAARVEIWPGQADCIVLVEWCGQTESRTVYHGSGLVRILQDPSPTIPPDSRLPVYVGP